MRVSPFSENKRYLEGNTAINTNMLYNVRNMP